MTTSELDYDARTNVCAVIALLTALLGFFLPGLVFGVIGMIQCGRRGEDGWGMAFAGALISAIVFLILLLWLGVVIAST
ncbi:hypothetical protein [Williamsia limnetica]|jgi:hypothetical protein|nr:hypothetical protein [Williamsia limnetica]